MLSKLKNTTGFTIIEVVIVLAIAGLIFAVVFIAVPQLQAAQRDSARQSEMGRFDAAINQYQANNNGNLPREGSQIDNDLIPDYLNNDFADPIGGDYSVFRNPKSSVGYENAGIRYVRGYKCSGSSITPGGSRSYAVQYELEQGGLQCRDNR